jgi:hypothetical protein
LFVDSRKVVIVLAVTLAIQAILVLPAYRSRIAALLRGTALNPIELIFIHDKYR